MLILAIDPGPEESAFLVYLPKQRKIENATIMENERLVEAIQTSLLPDVLAIEMVASYGMPVGKEVFGTCVWIGRFIQAWGNRPYRMIYRKDIKMYLCQSPRAKDAHVRQALIDKFGKPGTKKNPGVTYGLKSHLWSALAIAVTYHEVHCEVHCGEPF